MSETQTRVGGSGMTAFSWNGQTIAWLQTIADTAPRTVAAPVPVQALDDEHPKEIVTARAVGNGELRLTFFELWNQNVWEALPGFAGYSTLIEVLKRQLALNAIVCRKFIKLPNGSYRTRVYYNCVISDVDNGETISIQTMVLPKGITVLYTHANEV